jgi:hypothetical protein
MERGRAPLVNANWNVTAKDSQEARIITAKLTTAERLMYRYTLLWFSLHLNFCIFGAYLKLRAGSSLP